MAKASHDFSAYSVFDQELFQLSFINLHPTPKDVQNNSYRVHETKLIYILIYYAFFRDKANYKDKNYIHVNDQLTSPYFLNYGLKLKWEYLTGTLKNFDHIKNSYLFKPKEASERPLIVPLEALEPCEQYHTYHLEGTVRNQAFLNIIKFHKGRKATDFEKEIRKTVKASITEIGIDKITDLLADLLSKDDHFNKV